MIDPGIAPWLLAGLPLLGASLGFLLWSQPDRLRNWSVFVSIVTLAGGIGLSGHLTFSSDGPLLLYLLPLTAAASLLGQPIHRDHRSSWIMTLIFLGLGLGALTNGNLAGQAFLLALLGSVIVLLHRHHTALWPISWWGIGAYGLATLCIAFSTIAGPPLSEGAILLTCAVLLPLVPFHDGYLTALTRLPGSLPSFIALLFPALGLHGLATVLPSIPDVMAATMPVLALVGALYGAMKALAQSRVRLLLAYGGLSLCSMLWWFVVSSRMTTPQASLFIGAAGLATSGLLLAWQVIRTRYGDDVDPQAISGLASTMPRYAVLLSLLALAAMGLPPFGLFAGFIGLFLSPPVRFSPSVFLLAACWLAASWYIMAMAQRLLFGVRRADLRYADLLDTELAGLLILVLVLIALGIVPTDLFAPSSTTPTGALTGSIAWSR